MCPKPFDFSGGMALTPAENILRIRRRHVRKGNIAGGFRSRERCSSACSCSRWRYRPPHTAGSRPATRAAPSSRSSPGGRAAARPPASPRSSAIWNKENPTIKFINAAVAGGAGTNAKAVLAQRLAANDPPDSFQGHAGAELQDYIKAGSSRRSTSIYKQAGFGKIMPEQLIEPDHVQGPPVLGAGEHPPRERPLVQPRVAQEGGHHAGRRRRGASSSPPWRRRRRPA